MNWMKSIMIWKNDDIIKQSLIEEDIYDLCVNILDFDSAGFGCLFVTLVVHPYMYYSANSGNLSAGQI